VFNVTGGEDKSSLLSFMSKPNHSEPLHEEPDGTYITKPQMQFFLNREHGEDHFKCGDPEFVEYYNLCRVYNLVSDIMDKDEDAAILFWDPKKRIISMGFPEDGVVEKALALVDPLTTEWDDDDEDY